MESKDMNFGGETGVRPGKEFGLPWELGETVQFRETDGTAGVESGRGT